MNHRDGDLHRRPERLRVVGGWIHRGQLRHRVDVTDGLDAAPAGCYRPGRGENFGKSLVRVAPDSA